MFALMTSRFGRQRRRHSTGGRPGSDLATCRTETLEQRQLLSTDAVLDWNAVALDAIRTDRTAPPLAARNLAIIHTAIYDAVNSIDRSYLPYVTTVEVHPRASKDAAVATAARNTLVALFPAQQATFDAHYAAALGTIADGDAEDDGITAGTAAATGILTARNNDGSTAVVPYTPGTNPGDWQPTPPGFLSPVLPQWPGVRPFAMKSSDQFLPAAPPALESSEYAAALNEVRLIGSATSTTRTADQSAVAQFWANGPGTSTPPGHWNVIAGIVSQTRMSSLEDNARLFAMLNVALADAGISCWDAKYEYDMWRPVTAIQRADTDNNPATTADLTWKPLLITPAFPTYSSGHSTFSGAGAAVLKAFFGTDRISFVLPSESAGIADRRFTSFSQAADESGLSRIYGGIHFSFDNTAGLTAGRRIGRYVAAELFGRNHQKPTAVNSNGELIVRGSSQSDSIRLNGRSGFLSVTANGRKLAEFAFSAITSVVIDAGDGHDVVTLINIGIDSEIYGGAGSDTLTGGFGNDSLFGEGGNDILSGGDGHDHLNGGSGRNVLFGNRGNDRLIGIRGRDLLFGGSGLDDLLWG